MGRDSYLTEITRFCNYTPPPRDAQLNYSNLVMKDVVLEAYQRQKYPQQNGSKQAQSDM